ncbi:hypothetical protein LXD69_07175 [Flavobacterium sediminilitoris]|uniref:Phage protein n=1 Tax=Flavobacterium sediminilitoris TaxID=2024526 RepID=A0ABY4HQX3_9FLAO|nr:MULTISPECIES: hypothetical protein [Flavobacterium]UOX35292.1 hypothetical protein LXD69_07175 [Flavobacterium sediminilitoris]
MKAKPIIFSTEMVQAILEVRKSQTRRMNGLKKINEYPNDWVFEDFDFTGNFIFYNKSGDKISIKPPYEASDVLWVRETFVEFETWNELEQIFSYHYKADFYDYTLKYRPSIYMPKEACRLFLKIKNIRIERLNDISETDAIAEGVEKIADYGTTGYKLYTEPDAAYSDIDAVYSFESLWESIKGKKSWSSNPWVWVIDFEQCKKPKNF